MMKQFYFLFLILGLLSLWACEHTDTRESYTGFHNDKPENPREREEWRAKMRGGFVDPKVKMQALKQLNKLLEKQNAQPLTKDAGLNAWTEKGPYGIGGRIRGFAVDPNDNNHLFVGSVGGGIWETTDAGVTWNQLMGSYRSRRSSARLRYIQI